MNAEYGEYAAEIVNALIAIESQTMDNRKSEWTAKIKEIVRGIGRKHKFNVCPSKEPGDEREWLYDMIWYKNNKSNRLEMVPLVLESEWGFHPETIREDFEKLLVANSPLKVMVFQTSEPKIEESFNRLQCGINEFIFGVTSIYVLVCFYGSRVEIRTFKKEPPRELELMDTKKSIYL